jgi:hypothetical protein
MKKNNEFFLFMRKINKKSAKFGFEFRKQLKMVRAKTNDSVKRDRMKVFPRTIRLVASAPVSL